MMRRCLKRSLKAREMGFSNVEDPVPVACEL